ncbi:MAG: hypothetical protein DDT32_02246 [Syntrophomonadaceae bacterium]|nr:hypothetical protein [Bacillota bacterium]MBT9148472.1 hypothetical protein [Bacillota bacterium]
MQQRPQSIQGQVLPLVIQIVGGVIILLIIWLVLDRLPMVREIQLPAELKFDTTELLAAVILTIMMIMLVNFGMRMELSLGRIVPTFPQSGRMLKLLMFLIVIAIGYHAYLPLIEPHWGDLDWIYPVGFLVLFVITLAMLGYTIYIHIDRLGTLFSGLFTSGEKPVIATAEGPLCPGCGKKNKAGAGFCSFCGAKLPQPATSGTNCKGCGAALKPDSRFCAACGFTVGEASS